MKTITLSLLFTLALTAQTAKYPAAIVTDADLGVPKNRVQTTLSVAMSPTDTVIIVPDASKFVPNSLVTIDSRTATEIMLVCAVAGNFLTVGTATSCPSVGGRGYDGTSAISHARSETVSIYLNAWQVRSLQQEVKALETTLGPNLSNAKAGAITSTDQYDFAPQTPGGTLNAGNNTITLAPVPPGVNGTDTRHYLYISAGIGTAEKCLITGGSGLAGAPSGQIIIQCTNSHSGGWQIKSATAGIQEAYAATVGASYLFVPAGLKRIYAPIALTPAIGHSATLACAGWDTILQAQDSSTNIIELSGAAGTTDWMKSWTVQDCAFTSAVTRTGGAGIQVGYGTDNIASIYLHHLQFDDMYDCISVLSAGLWVVDGYSNFRNAIHTGITVQNLVNGDNGDNAVIGNEFEGSPSAAHLLIRSASGYRIVGNKFIGATPNAIDVSWDSVTGNGSVWNIAANSFEVFTNAGIRFRAVGTTYATGRTTITGNEFGSAGNGYAVDASYTGEMNITGNQIAGVGLAKLGPISTWHVISSNILNGAGFTGGVLMDFSAVTGGYTLITDNLFFAPGAPRIYSDAAAGASIYVSSSVGDATFAYLPTGLAAGSHMFCRDCQVTSGTDATCKAGGGGAFARYYGGKWVCN